MSDDSIRVTIEGDESSTPRGGRSSDTAYVPSPETRRVFAERSSALNELRDVKIQENLSRQHLLATKANAEQDAAKQAWEVGEIDRMHGHQRNASAFDAERIQAEAEGRRLEATPYLPRDPVEAFIQGRDSATQAWLREHMDDALVLATSPNSQRALKLDAADRDAVAEGFERGSKKYFEHVESFVGMRTDSKRQPKQFLKAGELPKAGQKDTVHLSKREYELATDGSITWESGPKKGQPLGAAEYIRRRRLIDNDPRWFRLPS
jgi:hypothetical protein